MKLDAEKIQKLEDFLDYIESQTYPEPVSQVHDAISGQMLDRLLSQYQFPERCKVLDVGCGQGVALEKFKAQGFIATGITLNQQDVDTCVEKGFNVSKSDQSFLEFEDNSFDLVWNRHCIEHSIFPFFTLHGLFRVLRKGGLLYLEVPAPDTSARHQTNPNHYSVMQQSMWIELITRTGFTLQETLDLDFNLPAGPDKYLVFIAKK